MPSRILVIEDEQDIRELIAINLTDVGHDVHTAATGRAGLTAASGPLRPGLILLDLNLPDVDGIDVCRDDLLIEIEAVASCQAPLQVRDEDDR